MSVLILIFDEIIYFWFNEVGFKKWYVVFLVFDVQVCWCFVCVVDQYVWLMKVGVYFWLGNLDSVFVLVLLFDQFLCNIWCGLGWVFFYDVLVCNVVLDMIDCGFDWVIDESCCDFVYMLFMYGENFVLQDLCIDLVCECLEGEGMLRYVIKYCEVIVWFGCFFYCNEVLGWVSMDEECEYLEIGGYVFGCKKF